MNVLELQNVSAGYGGDDVLKALSFSLPIGSRLAILGPNGSGKTTLLRAVAGLLPYEGSILLNGKEVQSLSRKEIACQAALMGQFSGASMPYTVYETVLLGRYLQIPRGLFGKPSLRDHTVAKGCIAATGLCGLEKTSITELSGGQQQRVYLARTLAQEPKLILLDEPTSHLDLKYQAELVEYLRNWGEQDGHTVVGVLHDLTLALRLCDTVLLLQEGRAAAFGPVKEVLRPKLLEEVYGMDVAGYLRAAYHRWEELKDE